MDPINIFIAINFFLLFFANIGGAKQGVRRAVGKVQMKSKSKLQFLPNLSAFILILLIVSLFQVGTLEYRAEYLHLRIIALAVYLAASWVQIGTMKTLGDSYSQEMVILKNHILVQKSWFKRLRHPQYLAQIIGDTAVCAALMSYIALPFALVQIPLLVLRAKAEDELLAKHFGEEFEEYKSRSSFIIPFVW